METANGPAIRAEIQAAFGPLLVRGLTPLLIAHFRKSDVGDDDPTHGRVAGNASGIVGAARMVLAVEKHGQGDHVLTVVKGNDGPRPDDLHFDVQMGYHPVAPFLTWNGSTAPAPSSGGGGGGPSIPTDDQLLEAADEAGDGEPVTVNRVCVELFGSSASGKPKVRAPAKMAIRRRYESMVNDGRMVVEKVTVAGQTRDGFKRAAAEQETAGDSRRQTAPSPATAEQETGDTVVRTGVSVFARRNDAGEPEQEQTPSPAQTETDQPLKTPVGG